MGKVVTRLIAMPGCIIATDKCLFVALDAEVSNRSIPCENSVGYASDRVIVMGGIYNSVLSCVQEKQGNNYIQPAMCMPPCYIVCSTWYKGFLIFC